MPIRTGQLAAAGVDQTGDEFGVEIGRKDDGHSVVSGLANGCREPRLG